MGKNQAYKAMQRARIDGFSYAVPDQIENSMEGELRKGELEADTDKMMKKSLQRKIEAETRLEGEGFNETQQQKKDLRSRRGSSDSTSSSSHSSSSSEDDGREARRSRSKRSK